jgi:uncharacterized membrane protein
MFIFTVMGMVWAALMGLRGYTLWLESKIFYGIFLRNKYTKSQALYTVVTKVFLPSLLAAPAFVFLDRTVFFNAPSAEQVYEVAMHIDRVLKERAKPTANEETGA